MAILPSTSDTRGRSVVYKPLAASDTSSPELAPNGDTSLADPAAKDETPLPLPLNDASTPSEERAIIADVENLDPRHSEFWLHMTTTLEACFSSSKDSSDEDNLSTISDDMLSNAPRTMQTFLSHGDACTKMEAKVLNLVSNAPVPQDEDEPLKAYTDVLDDLEHLQHRAASLELSISRLAGIVNDKPDEDGVSGGDADGLTSPNSVALSELRRVFAACLPVLHARKANLTMAQDLIDSAQENRSISLKMEYLGID